MRLAREGGARRVIRDMRYMWSAIDSVLVRDKRRQPSRGVDFRRERRGKKAIGVGGVWLGILGVRVERTRRLSAKGNWRGGGEQKERTGIKGPGSGYVWFGGLAEG